MTVAELIEKLRAMPQDMRVVVDGYEGGFDDPKIFEQVVILDGGSGWPNGRHRDCYDPDCEKGQLVIRLKRDYA
jgi:hypothetical protein